MTLASTDNFSKQWTRGNTCTHYKDQDVLLTLSEWKGTKVAALNMELWAVHDAQLTIKLNIDFGGHSNKTEQHFILRQGFFFATKFLKQF